jgi:hypothetical protein
MGVSVYRWYDEWVQITYHDDQMVLLADDCPQMRSLVQWHG